MRGSLDADIKEEIRRRVDLVELASAHVALKKAGRHYKGLCPFHPEKTPSFQIDRDRGLWYCHGCKKGGDLFGFVMQISNLTFPEALEVLARRAGVDVERTPDAARQSSERDRRFQAVQAATEIFRAQLMHPTIGAAARAYLERRGVDQPTADRFALGYATPGWEDLLGALKGKGFPVGVAEAAGLVVSRPRGDGHYDLFRDRLMFPLFDLQDRPVAFSGRILGEGQPKYLNSKETTLFAKARTLYAFNWAREAIRGQDEIVVVEGNMDVLTAHQMGIPNVVASLGTALTHDHVLIMKRFASRAVLVYDSDAAGQAATERAMALFEEAELPVRVAVLPTGDPDAFLRNAGPDAFRNLVAAALPVFDYHLKLLEGRHDARTVDGKLRIAEDIIPVIAAVANPLRQAEYIREVGQRYDLQEDALRQRMRGRVRAKPVPQVKAPLVASTDRARDQAERLLIHLMVHDPTLRPQVGGQVTVEDFTNPTYRLVAHELVDAQADNIATVLERFSDEDAKALVMRLAFEEPPVVEKEKARVVEETVEYLIRREPAAARRTSLATAIHAAQLAGDVEQVRRLQTEYLQLVTATPYGKGGKDRVEEKDRT